MVCSNQLLIAFERVILRRGLAMSIEQLTPVIRSSLTTLFSELVDGAPTGGGAFILNSGDAGLLRSLDKLSAAEASRSVQGGAAIAAHARHLQYGLSLMNRWASEGGNPFADAKWDEAWRHQPSTTPNGARSAAACAMRHTAGSARSGRHEMCPGVPSAV